MTGPLVYGVFLLAFFGLTNLVRGDLGEEAWSFQTMGEVFGSPAIGADGSVFFGSRDGNVYSLKSDGSLRWEFETDDWVDSSPTLSSDESRVYVGSWDNFMYALSSSDGSEIWRFETGSLIVGSPALDQEGNLFFGSSDGFLYSLDPSGALRWSFYVGVELDSSPAVDEEGNVYLGGFDGILYSLSNDGSLRWEFAARESEEAFSSRIAGPVAIGEGGVVYFGSADGYCYAVDSQGQLVWEFDTFDKVDTGVIVGNDGELIFASRNGSVYMIDAFGVLLWESYVGDVFFSTPTVDLAGNIYVGSYAGNGVSSLNVLDPEGEIVWEYLVLDYIDSPPVIDGLGRVVFGCYDGALYAVDAEATQSLSSWVCFGGGEAHRSLRLPYQPAVLSGRFAEWASELELEGVFADPCFDADADGKVLALEYLLGGDVDAMDSSGLEMGSGTIEGIVRIFLEYSVVVADDEVAYVIEYSIDGKVWAGLDTLPGTSSVLWDTDSKGDGWYETWRIYLPSEQPDGLLIRVRLRCS